MLVSGAPRRVEPTARRPGMTTSRAGGDLRLPEWQAPPTTPGEAAWRDGYVHARLGRHDLAWDRWRAVREPSLFPRVQASRGAVLRQVGLHDRAEVEDLAGLSLLPRDRSADADRAALEIGLVADAVGCHSGSEARRRLDRATRRVAGLDGSRGSDRQRIRLGWVTAEVVLFTDDLRLIVGAQLPIVTASGAIETPAVYRAGSAHHLAKGLLFAGVLLRNLRYLEVALDHAPPGLRWAVHAARADLGAPGAADAAERDRRLVRLPAHLTRRVA